MKQIPTYQQRGVTNSYGSDGLDYSSETNTDYLNKHAEEWKPPTGMNLHLHLMYVTKVHWRVVTRASSVCKVPGRCYKVYIADTQKIIDNLQWIEEMVTAKESSKVQILLRDMRGTQ